MKKTTWILMGLMLLVTTVAVELSASPVTIELDEDVEPLFGEDLDGEIEIDLLVDGIEVDGTIDADDFFGKPCIGGPLNVKNTNDTNKVVVIHLAFFDVDGNLVASTSQSSFDDEGMAPDEKTQFGSLLAFVSDEAIPTITRYQIKVYALEPVESSFIEGEGEIIVIEDF